MYFFKFRGVSGKEITLSEGTTVKTVFIDDQRLVRLKVKEPVYNCQEEMYTTNYPLLFLIPVATKSTLSDGLIDPDDVDLNLKFDLQDNWIYSYTGRSIEDFAAKTLEMLCLGEQQLYANKYAVLAAAQQAVLAGGTIALSHGQFATIGGEALHVYQCPRIKVQAIDAKDCYDSLPVRLTPQDHDRLVGFEQQQQQAKQRQLHLEADEFTNSSAVQFFLEPHSQLISTISAVSPCLPQFAAYYQNDRGQWVTADPAIRTVAPPCTLQPLNPEQFQHHN